MSPVPREPVNTIVECTGKKLRAVIFDGGSPSPDVSRTVHIPHENIKKSWKKQLKFQTLYRDRSQPQVSSVTDPVPSSTSAEDNAPAYDGPDLTPVKFRRMNTFTARQNIIMAAAHHDLRFRCWHFWSRGAMEAHRHIANVIHVHTRCIR